MSGSRLVAIPSLLIVLATVMAVFAVAPGHATPGESTGLFVLGDATVAQASPSDTVTFWSHSWWTANSLTQGPADPSFKGLAVDFSSNEPTCGDTWTTGPGNSPHPPESVPDVITVVVTDQTTKTGATISGNIVRVVQVATDPGYGPNPGHPGTGKIVATLCGAVEPE